MPAKLMIVWDYDTALGQVNSTYPYNFKYDPIYQEIENVEYLLKVSGSSDFKMTFACVGFAAEKGVFPFNNPDQIKKIFDEGHEIASHSWRHEWFPYLAEKQIQKSIERSKYILEECTGKKNSVNGFVLPHSRPMSWLKKFSYSPGDRGSFPFSKGADMGFILKKLSEANYKWCRVLKSFKPVWKKIFNNSPEEKIIFPKWEIHNDIVCVPHHYTGFDEPAQRYLDIAVEKNESLVIAGHPAALSRNGSESLLNFNSFTEKILKYRSEGRLEIMSVDNFIKKNNTSFAKN
ncbi:MAG: polysaccharide deacetylase family protein [Ignavibacteria bacterium]